MFVDYVIEDCCPSVSEYINMRKSAGLSAKSVEAATRGLVHTWFGVSLRYKGECIAMGRIVGDDGCVFHVVDIAVLPLYQRQGLGSVVMQRLMDKLHKSAPETALVTLLADGEAYKLYEKFGFAKSAPASIGMTLRL
jgi:ribosomal protein S18 acetylase RimI-like enzyme